MTNNVMIMMIRDNGNSCGFTYTLLEKDADYVEREIKLLMEYCNDKCIEEEK